jgi:hypothetical protein
MRVFEKRMLGRIIGAKRNEETGDWSKLQIKELHNMKLTSYNQNDQVKEDGIGRTCNTHGIEGGCIHRFSRKAMRKETIRKT